MAFHNTNWTAVNLPVGTYEMGELGNGITASTVHQIFCLTGGSITVSAIGGVEYEGTGSVVCQATVSINANTIFSANATVNGTVLVNCFGRILGDNWSDETVGSESWTGISASTTTWTVETAGSESWTAQSASSTTWTQISSGNSQWQ